MNVNGDNTTIYLRGERVVELSQGLTVAHKRVTAEVRLQACQGKLQSGLARAA